MESKKITIDVVKSIYDRTVKYTLVYPVTSDLSSDDISRTLSNIANGPRFILVDDRHEVVQPLFSHFINGARYQLIVQRG